MAARESRGSFATAAARLTKASTYSSDFTRLSKVIANNIQKIQSNVRQMKTMLNDLSRKPDDTLKLSRLHEFEQKTNVLVKETGKYLQDLKNIQTVADTSEEKRQKIQKERMMSTFSKTLDEFLEIQKQEKEKTKAQVTRDRLSVKHMKNQISESSAAPVTESYGRQKDQIVVQAELTDIDLQLMQEREESLLKLEADIKDVHQIFQDLGMMIHEQGEVLDTIEDNVVEAALHVEQGKKEMSEAHSSKIRAGKKKCIIIIVVLVVIAVILVIILASVLPNTK